MKTKFQKGKRSFVLKDLNLEFYYDCDHKRLQVHTYESVLRNGCYDNSIDIPKVTSILNGSWEWCKNSVFGDIDLGYLKIKNESHLLDIEAILSTKGSLSTISE